MFDELTEQVKDLLARKSLVVVAISGHGGSGKSTLADRLGRQFGTAEDQIIRTDNLHAKNYMHAQNIFEQRDWDTIMELLSHLKTGTRLKYLKRDDQERESMVDVARPQVVIFEGIHLLRPQIMPFVDISVWIDCPIELAAERAKERNRLQGDSAAEIALWDTKWVPEARQYFKQVRPDRIASFIYKEYA